MYDMSGTNKNPVTRKYRNSKVRYCLYDLLKSLKLLINSSLMPIQLSVPPPDLSLLPF